MVEGDDRNDPVGDAVRSIVDGHIVLSRELANRAHYPAIDVPASVSRVMREVVAPEHLQLSQRLKETLATYRNAEDLISIGAYVDGTDPKIDFAKKMIDKINTFLRQDIGERVSIEEGINRLKNIFEGDSDETL